MYSQRVDETLVPRSFFGLAMLEILARIVVGLILIASGGIAVVLIGFACVNKRYPRVDASTTFEDEQFPDDFRDDLG